MKWKEREFMIHFCVKILSVNKRIRMSHKLQDLLRKNHYNCKIPLRKIQSDSIFEKKIRKKDDTK